MSEQRKVSDKPEKPGRPARYTKPKKDFGFTGRIITLAVSLIALGFSWYTYRAINRAPLNDRIREVEMVKTDEEWHKIVREEYQLYQSDQSSILAVAGIVFALFTFGYPILQYKFITKEHVVAMKEGLEELGKERQRVFEAQKSLEGLKNDIIIGQVNPLRQQQENLRKQQEEFQSQVNFFLEQIGEQVQGHDITLHQFVRATGQAPAQPIELLPKIGASYDFGKSRWKVLDVDIANNRALLLSKDIIEELPYHTEFTAVTWEDCSLRKYLNGKFYKRFTPDEQKRIIPWDNENPDNQWYGTDGGRRTEDNVFLLSIGEVVKYFGDSGDLAARKGWYWETGEAVLKDGKGCIINDEYNDARVAKLNNNDNNGNNGRSWWWLRSLGYTRRDAATVYRDGTVRLDGNDAFRAKGGVRPALWLNL